MYRLVMPHTRNLDPNLDLVLRSFCDLKPIFARNNGNYRFHNYNIAYPSIYCSRYNKLCFSFANRSFVLEIRGGSPPPRLVELQNAILNSLCSILMDSCLNMSFRCNSGQKKCRCRYISTGLCSDPRKMSEAVTITKPPCIPF